MNELYSSLEPPLGDSSNEYPQSMFLSQNKQTNIYPFNQQISLHKMGCLLQENVKVM